MKATDIEQQSGSSTLAPFWIAAVFAALSVVYALMYGTGLDALKTESGAVEIASAMLWVFAAVTAVWVTPSHIRWQRWHVPALFLLFAARELDFDKRFLSQGILKARLYSGDAPIHEKLIGLAVIAVILVVCVRLVRRNWRDIITGLTQGVAWVWAAVIAFGLAGFSKTIDGAGRKLSPLGIEIPASVDYGISVVEEVMELAFAVVAILAVCLYESHRARTSRTEI